MSYYFRDEHRRPEPTTAGSSCERCDSEMYEMYPDRWADDHDERLKATSERPRRRARRSHRVAPRPAVELQQARGTTT